MNSKTHLASSATELAKKCSLSVKKQLQRVLAESHFVLEIYVTSALSRSNTEKRRSISLQGAHKIS